MKRLHVNIDHCATVREARGTSYPDPIWAASLAELAGAHGITAHLREDRRHVQDRDLRLLRETVRTVLNMEMAATDEMLRIATEVRPDIVTLVPERREERTTEGGLDLSGSHLSRAVETLREQGIDVSLFVAPDSDAVEQAVSLGASTVEFHTGDYCHAQAHNQIKVELKRLRRATQMAQDAGLKVAAGHGLDYANVSPVFAIDGIEEFNIGHAIIARAIFVGMDRAVGDMLALLVAARG